MEAEDPARRRLSALMDKRRADLRLRWDDVAVRAEVSVAHLRRVRGSQAPLTPFVAAAIEDALEWSRGSIERILQGGEPTGTANISGSAHLSASSNLTAVAEVESEWPVAPDHPPPDIPRIMSAGYAGLSETERGILWLRGATPAEREHLVYSWRAVHEATLAAQAEAGDVGAVTEFKRDR